MDTIKPKFTKNALTVLERRYLKRDANGDVCETAEGMLKRVARNIASAEKIFNKHADTKKWEETFYEVMAKLEFVPNSPTLMNAGRELQQLSACFVLPVGDSINSIFEVVKNTAMIHKSGGGTGFSFSNIRPKNDIVSTSHGLSSGPISFMKVFNEATEAINQGGFRRGANMAILNCDHPDILEFITCKQDEKQLNNFNISVGLTEEFMRLAEEDGEYDLINPRSKKLYKRLKARQVFDLIVRMAWQSGEPGIVFIDRLNKANPTPHIGHIESTNPCGEQPLLPYESCNLASINLAEMVDPVKPYPPRPDFNPNKAIKWDKLKKTVHIAVRFLDNVIEMNNYPLPMIGQMTKGNRKIGLGVMGFADLLIKTGIPYNSEAALELGESIMKFISDESRNATRELAKERGAFPNFTGSIYDRAGEPPVRNATTTTIAPTGTISIIAGCSSGIEPLYAVCFVRNVLDGDKLVEAHPAFEALARERGFYSRELMTKIASKNSIKDIEEIPKDIRDVFITAHDVSPEWHIKMQAAFQKYTDNAVSKTVNFCNEATMADVEQAYFLAYRLGCKGVTVYRDGSRSQQVLTTSSETKPKMESDKSAQSVVKEPFAEPPRPRPELTFGSTRKMKTGCGNLYITVNYDENNKPFELFSTMGKAGGCAASQSEAISRLISFALRSGASTDDVIKQLRGISCHSIAWGKNGKILSCADAIGQALGESLSAAHTGETTQGPGGTRPEGRAAHTPASPSESEAGGAPKTAAADKKTAHHEHPAAKPHPGSGGTKKTGKSESLKKGACPDCGGILTYEEGCIVCHACGYSECG